MGDRVPQSTSRMWVGVVSAHVCIRYAPLAIFAARSIALRFGRGAMVGACKLAGRSLGGVRMPVSDSRESERRGEFTSPCADAGRPNELVDRDKVGPIGCRTTRTLTLTTSCRDARGG